MNKKSKHPGITAMTAIKHGFDGYSVRKQTGGLKFQQYFSAARLNNPEYTASQRRANALALAKSRLKWLNLILSTPSNYYRGGLNKTTLHIIAGEGFKITKFKPKTKK